MTSALRVQPDVILNPDVEIRDIAYPDRICGNSETAFTVQLYNAGQFTGIGTVELYIDGSLAGSTITDIQPGELLNVPFQVNVPPSGSHQVKAVYEGKFSTRTRTETFEVNDNDCDGWLNEIEEEYGTNPDNPDTDGDSVMDPQDVDPFRDAVVELYLFRARALDPAEYYDQDWDVDFQIEATFKAGNMVQTVKENLPDNTRDVENLVTLGNSVFENIQNEAVAVLKFNPPDNVDTVEIDLKLVDRDPVWSDIMDISPKPGNNEAGKVAKLFFSLRNGTWWGDDSINDHKVYFGYGHLSGADDSTEDYTNGGEYDAEPFSKYYDDLEALGYDLNAVNITSVRGWDGVGEVSYSPGRNKLLKIINPAEVVEFTLSLPDGKEKKVVLVNSRGARVLKFSSSQKVLKFKNIESAPEMTPWDLVREEYTSLISAPNSTLIKLKNSKMSTIMSEPKDVQIAQVYDIDEDDAEIWFLIKTNDEDGIPFYRELELNRELEDNGSVYSFDPSDGFGIDDPDEHHGFIQHDAYGDYDGDGVPNVVEQFIGKDPALRDVLGIKLSVAVGWDANQTYLTQLVKGFQRASQVVYDYTDGYAMIAEVNITNNAPEGSEKWRESMIVIHNDESNGLYTDTPIIPHNPEEPASSWVIPIPGYWLWFKTEEQDNSKPHVHLYKIYKGTYPDHKVYYGGIAHELGHFVFALGDEYFTRNIYNIKEEKYKHLYYDTIISLCGLKNFTKLHTIMEAGDKMTELSTPRDYIEFNNQLINYYPKIRSTLSSLGWKITKWEDLITSHLGDNRYYYNGTLHENLSGWEVFVAIMNYTEFNYVNTTKIQINIDAKKHIPFVGPYTGVGYYLIVKVEG
ncbi:CARDB domain-containing protein [Thermococcus sp.]